MKGFLKYLFVVTVIFSAAHSMAQDESSAGGDKAADDSHKGHSHKKIDKNDPKYKEYIEQKVNAYEKYKKDMKEFEESDEFNKNILSSDLEFDINVGDPNAPIKIVEYASLSCGHCKNFHKNVFYNLKKDYIDTGKVYFKYRHYPLNGSAVKGALIVECAPEANQQATLGALFKGQGQWAFAKNESQLIDRLQTIALIAGLDKEEFSKCYGDEERQKRLLELMKKANKELKVDSTPTVFINGSRYLKSRDYDTFKAHIETILPTPAE